MKLLLGTNWKMHKTAREAVDYTRRLCELLPAFPDIQLFVIPSYTALWQVREAAGDSGLLVGAQNMHWADEGAYTGEVSPTQLAEIGLDLVEIGHSERREYYNETDEACGRKVAAAQQHGFTALLCIGETIDDKNAGVGHERLSVQLQVALRDAAPDRLWIAYEPVWSIGERGTPADPDYVFAAHAHIRALLCERFGEAGRNVPILYGGSVNRDNSPQYLAGDNVDGLFIGRSAWQADSFHEIMNLAAPFAKKRNT